MISSLQSSPMARQWGDWYWRPRIKRDELLVMGINSRECGLEFCWILDYPAGVKWYENKFEIILPPFPVVNFAFGCSISCGDGARHYTLTRNKGNRTNMIDIAARSSTRISTNPTKQIRLLDTQKNIILLQKQLLSLLFFFWAMDVFNIEYFLDNSPQICSLHILEKLTFIYSKEEFSLQECHKIWSKKRLIRFHVASKPILCFHLTYLVEMLTKSNIYSNAVYTFPLLP